MLDVGRANGHRYYQLYRSSHTQWGNIGEEGNSLFLSSLPWLHDVREKTILLNALAPLLSPCG